MILWSLWGTPHTWSVRRCSNVWSAFRPPSAQTSALVLHPAGNEDFKVRGSVSCHLFIYTLIFHTSALVWPETLTTPVMEDHQNYRHGLLSSCIRFFCNYCCSLLLTYTNSSCYHNISRTNNPVRCCQSPVLSQTQCLFLPLQKMLALRKMSAGKSSILIMYNDHYSTCLVLLHTAHLDLDRVQIEAPLHVPWAVLSSSCRLWSFSVLLGDCCHWAIFGWMIYINLHRHLWQIVFHF